MYTFFLIIHVIVSVLLILIILLQIGRAGSLGGLFGGGGGDQLLSTPSGSQLLRKVTIVLSLMFLVTTVSLTVVSYRKKLKTVTGKIPATAPAAPAPGPAAPPPQQ